MFSFLKKKPKTEYNKSPIRFESRQCDKCNTIHSPKGWLCIDCFDIAKYEELVVFVPDKDGNCCPTFYIYGKPYQVKERK